jgi:putative GTP pyrophosphokinase
MTTKQRVNEPIDEVERVVKQYEEQRSLYVDFTDKLKVLIESLLNNSEIKFQVIEHRTKDVSSFREKISRENKSYSDPLREITDLSGLRVIVYYLEDVERACKVIEQELCVDSDASGDKLQLLKPNEFGYRSIHYIASLSDSRKDLLEWHRFQGLTAEIQIRTVLQHAWAAISHALQYKVKEDVPSTLQRKLSRLSGLLELSDEEFSALKEEQQQFARDVSNDIGLGKTALEINAISLKAYFQSSPIQFLAVAAEQAQFTLVDEYKDDINSRIVSACSAAGIRTISQLDDLLHKSKGWAVKYLESQFAESGYGTWKVSIPFLVELIVLHSDSDLFDVVFLTNSGWDRDVAERVARVAKRKL